jgi:hypothetical protein
MASGAVDDDSSAAASVVSDSAGSVASEDTEAANTATDFADTYRAQALELRNVSDMKSAPKWKTALLRLHAAELAALSKRRMNLPQRQANYVPVAKQLLALLDVGEELVAPTTKLVHYNRLQLWCFKRRMDAMTEGAEVLATDAVLEALQAHITLLEKRDVELRRVQKRACTAAGAPPTATKAKAAAVDEE